VADKKKCLRQSLNEAEIFEPATFGDIRSCLQPDPETVEVVGHVTVVHALDQMIAHGCRDARPGLDLGPYSPKTRRPNSSKSFGLLRIARGSKASGKLEESFLFLFPRFNAEFNELHQNTVVAQALALCHALYLLGDGGGERCAPADVFVVGMASLYTNLVHPDADAN
jgi:hypothetical protein